MTTKELQTWLFEKGFFDKGTTREKAVDGRMGNMTRNALRKAQEKLKGYGLYTKIVDGKAGQGTFDAIAAWNKGWATVSGPKGKKFTFNRYEQDHVRQLRDWTLKNGIGKITLAGHTFTLGDADTDIKNLYDAARASVSGQKYKPGATSFSSETTFVKGGGTQKPSDYTKGWASSYNKDDLDNLVMRYAFDRFHGIKTDDNVWGISYDYSPSATIRKDGGIGLTVSNMYTPEQAEQIARGAGLSSYTYNGKTYNVNLFKGSEYRDAADFEAKITALEQAGRAEEAQALYNAELKRQYNTYGVDHVMLKNKNNKQWNNLFGVSPYGYSDAGIKAIYNGVQSYQGKDDTGQIGGLTSYIYGYRNDGTNKGRLVYDNFDQWYQGRILANPKYQRNGGIGAVRAVTSTYFAGIPVTKNMRGQLAFIGAKKNSDTQIDRTNFYDITDKTKGSGQMQAWLYNEVSKNPQAAYAYMRHIFGDRKATTKNGRTTYSITGDRSRQFDEARATQLAGAAGMTPYHLNKKGNDKDFIGQPESFAGITIKPHDIWDSLKSFYENGFDADGNLLSDFRYTEQGYNHNFDGGAYGVKISGGKATHAEDYWDAGLGYDWIDKRADLAAGIKNKSGIARGIPLITRFEKFGGRLLIMCQSGGGLKGGSKKHDVVDTLQCAEWANSLPRENDYNISGNAWALNTPRKATTFAKVKSGIRNFFRFKYGGVIWGHQQ